jgi:hypothetical protein
MKVRIAPLVAVIFVTCIAFAPCATAYTCTISPKGDAVIVKTDNPGAEPLTCTVTCRFAAATFNCTQTIPAGARNWYVCLRPTHGKNIGQLQDGSEACKRR